jgi:predicted GNAT family acetyltransferase
VSEITVANNPRELRYELRVDGELAGEIRYRLQPGATVLVHTDVDPRFEGRGLATALIHGALEDIRATGTNLVPVCPFVREYLVRHPEYGGLVVPDDAPPE